MGKIISQKFRESKSGKVFFYHFLLVVKFLFLLIFILLIPVTFALVSHKNPPPEKDPSLERLEALDVNAQEKSILTSDTPAIKTVFVIIMENQNWSDIENSSSAPYINNTLLPIASYAREYYNPPQLHPSEPNYIWLEAGDNLGINTDNTPYDNHLQTTNHFTTLLTNAGILWKSYQEDISGSDCPLRENGLYAPKHNPMVFFDDVTNGNDPSSLSCILHVRPYSELAKDLDRNTVGQYNFITPNLCNDMHNSAGCESADRIKNGDAWLSAAIPQILHSRAYRDGGAIFITWDEGEDEGKNDSDGPIGLIVLSPYAKGKGYVNYIHYTHSSLLRTLEEIFHVFPLLGDSVHATDLGDLFITAPFIARGTTNHIAKFIARVMTQSSNTFPVRTNISEYVSNTPTISLTRVPINTQTPTITQQVSYATTSNEWAVYKENDSVKNAGFYFTYPTNWHVFYKINTSVVQSSFAFSFYPNDIFSSLQDLSTLPQTILSVDPYEKVSTIEEFIEKYYSPFKEKLAISVFGTVGNKTMYRISPKAGLPFSDPIYLEFGSHGVVLGSKHTYDIGFEDTTSQEMMTKIEKEILPTFYFE